MEWLTGGLSDDAPPQHMKLNIYDGMTQQTSLVEIHYRCEGGEYEVGWRLPNKCFATPDLQDSAASFTYLVCLRCGNDAVKVVEAVECLK